MSGKREKDKGERGSEREKRKRRESKRERGREREMGFCDGVSEDEDK